MADDDASDYQVGKNRPPLASRFQKGHAKRGGRKKAVAVNDPLEKALARTRAVTVNGKRARLTTGEVLIEKLVNDALQGDKAAYKLILQEQRKIAERQPAKAEAEKPKFRVPIIKYTVWQAADMISMKLCEEDEHGVIKITPWAAEAAFAKLTPEEIAKFDLQKLAFALVDPSILERYKPAHKP